jgi:hypothetical protein
MIERPRAANRFTRRRFLAAGALAIGGLGTGCGSAPRASGDAALLDDIERRAFDFFWETTDAATGLAPDRWPTPSFCSIAAVGFALTAYPIGVERAYVTRDQAIARVLATVRFFHRAPQGPQPSGTAGYKGFFYHFLDMRTGLRHGDVELSSVDTALLMGGMLFCRSYFDRATAAEGEIRNLVDEIYARIEWPWLQVRAPAISHGWSPEEGFIEYDWKGYSEAMIVYILALGSPTHAVASDAWSAWTSTYGPAWGTLYGFEHLTFMRLFGHQYSHVWIDFRGIRDPFMRGHGIDYFENSRRATYAQRAYAIANPLRWKGYGANLWGLTACDGPADMTLAYRGEPRRFWTYAARGFGLERIVDDGTLAPTAAAASLPFAPEIVIPAVAEMHRRHGERIYSRYGFLDSFNPSFEYDVALHHGRRVPGFGWVDNDYLGIDQGPIIAMIENHRSDLVWHVMRGNPHIRRGLERAGFTGGWLGSP